MHLQHARQPLDRSNSNFLGPHAAVGSGTDAPHLGYLLAGIEAGVEVLTPVFTCAATNIPLLYIGANIRFVDADPKLQFFQPNCPQSFKIGGPVPQRF